MYQPGVPPANPAELPTYLQREFDAIARHLAAVDNEYPLISYAAPGRIYEGMMVYADGTSWNPGAGAGRYESRAGVWYKL